MKSLSTFAGAFCAALLTTFTHAADAPAPLSAYRDASAQFAGLVQQAEAAKDPARLKSAQAEQLVAVLADAPRFLRPGVYAAAELKDLVELCDLANRANMSVALFDAQRQIDPKADPDAVRQKLATVMDGNLVAFPGALKRLQPFTLRCYAKEVPPLAEFAASLPPENITEQRRQGLRQVRLGIARVIVGTLRAIGDTRYDEDYRFTLAQALAETAPTLLQVVPLPEREPLGAVAANIAPAPRFVPDVARIREALEHAGCSVLCGF